MRRLLAASHRGRAAAAAQRLLFLDPLHEAACRTMMQVHAERGERAQALKLFERLRDRLANELSVTPEQETIDLLKSIRDSASPKKGPVNTQRSQAECAPALAATPSIAVLPFANIGGEPERDFFADGLTEDIITDLSRVSALFVTARSGVSSFKGRAIQAQDAARALRVRFILEGSVRAAESRVRITAQLVDGLTGGHLWAERFDRSLDDIFAVQAEISASIVEALKVKLLPEERAGLANHPTRNVEAYQAYLMGRSFYLRGMDKQSLRIARDLFFKATEMDPGYARAFAALAICGSYLSMRLSMDDPDEELDACLTHSLRALELDPGLAEGFAGKGLALYAGGRYAEATPEFERAIELGPDLFEAHFFYARNCRLQGLRRASGDAVSAFGRIAAKRLPRARTVRGGVPGTRPGPGFPRRAAALLGKARGRDRRLARKCRSAGFRQRGAGRSGSGGHGPRTGRSGRSGSARMIAWFATTSPGPTPFSAIHPLPLIILSGPFAVHRSFSDALRCG